MKLFKSIIVFIGFLALTSTALAQQGMKMQKPEKADSVSDQELSNFAAVTKTLQQVQKQSKKTVDSLLNDKNMSMQRFKQIMRSKRDTSAADSANITDQEQKTIQDIKPKLIKMQRQSQQQIIASIREHGLTPKRFQQIGLAVRTDPNIRKRFRQQLTGSGMNQGNQ